MRSRLAAVSRPLVRDLSPFRYPVLDFLCPALSTSRNASAPVPRARDTSKPFSTTRRAKSVAAGAVHDTPPHQAVHFSKIRKHALPSSCPGCGAISQNKYKDEAGYYSTDRKAVKNYLEYQIPSSKPENDVVSKALQDLDKSVLEQLGIEDASQATGGNRPEPSVPVCDRCHQLIHHHTGVPVYHPGVESIEATIAESPYVHNHIYHVIDAADFPMSLVPNLTRKLHLPALRTQNRRSKSHRFQNGREVEMSFIVTRSDLLAPTKEQVDRLMPYVQEVLRDALGRTGKNVRLGNVRLVSSKRGWWTKHVKEDIWKRGGGGWLVGKANVGKSNLFEVVFPKGRSEEFNMDKLRKEAGRDAQGPTGTPSVAAKPTSPTQAPTHDALGALEPGLDEVDDVDVDELQDIDLKKILPPAQRETQYPLMPTVSSLPGTTASPIRVPFGHGKGELIDLPGLARSDLTKYVRSEHARDLIMHTRASPERLVLKPGQTLILGGGLIRITPTFPSDVTFMAHCFVPWILKPHITSTRKAEENESGLRETGITKITSSDVEGKMRSSGKYSLQWDVTKDQAGPLTRRDAVALKTAQLPFVVYSADILIEGVGWIELLAQVRKRQRSAATTTIDTRTRDEVSSMRDDPFNPFPEAAQSGPEDHYSRARKMGFPEVEVFSPEGKFIGVRRPMGGSVLGGKIGTTAKAGARPRRSMTSVKKQRVKQSKDTTSAIAV